ncbi:MAG: dTMP kinase [Alphaproteobacteria bacterium]|nr:dTMP kinase [Alphaproteobacteria bacterium]
MAGLLITFEGGEGGGKTTQINRLAASLNARGHKVITTREPGGTPEGDKIRELLVRREGGDWTAEAEVMLIYAARVMNVERVIKPALAKGKIVLCDRFVDSTTAYQGYGHGLDLQWLRKVQDLVLGNFSPDLTFILDLDPEMGIGRTRRREAADALHVHQAEDRYENLDLSFHQKLRTGYQAIAQAEPGRCILIDASQDAGAVEKAIIKYVDDRLA